MAWRDENGVRVDPEDEGLVESTAVDHQMNVAIATLPKDVYPHIIVRLAHGDGCFHPFVRRWVVQAWRGLSNEQRNVDRLLDVVRAGPYALWVQRLIITSTLRGR